VKAAAVEAFQGFRPVCYRLSFGGAGFRHQRLIRVGPGPAGGGGPGALGGNAMRMKTRSVVSLIGACTLAGSGLLVSMAPAGASAQQVGADPIIGGVGFPRFVTVVGHCPSFFTDGSTNWSLDFAAGHGVFYGTSNKNGDWGGGNAEGDAILSANGAPIYDGHAHIWFGGGNNKAGQTEQGFTVSYQGSGAPGSIKIVGNGHTTTNNGATTTSNFQGATVTCS